MEIENLNIIRAAKIVFSIYLILFAKSHLVLNTRARK